MEFIARITPIVDLNEAVKDAEMVIEVVPEIMDLKKSGLCRIRQGCKTRSNLCIKYKHITNHRNCKYNKSRPEKFIGIHFFNPPQLMKLVEVIPGEKTAQEITELTQEFVKSVNKQAVLCRKDVPGFHHQ